jgi:polyisoprenoid-binding protein YceI
MENDMKFLILLHFALPALALASVTKLTPHGGSVEALAVGKPSFIKIRGKGEPAKGELKVDGKKASGVFEFQVGTLDTGIDLRNEHMREKYLQVKEHPTAKLEIKDLVLNEDFNPARPKISEQAFEGELTLHGVTKPVRGKFTVGEKRDVAADFKIKLSDFNVEIPKYLGVTVADEVNVEVKIAELKESK